MENEIENEIENKDGKLAEVLGKWRVNASLSTGFKASVWRRIERKDAAIWPRLIDAAMNVVRPLLDRPIPVAAFLIISTLVGMGIGEVHASVDSKKASVSLSENYLKMMDPSRHTRR